MLNHQRLYVRAALTSLLCIIPLIVYIVATVLAFVCVYVANTGATVARWIERKTLPPELPPIL